MSETKAAASPVAPDLPCPIGDHPRRDLAVLLDMIWATLCGLIALIISVAVQESLATRAGSDVSWKVSGLRGLAIAVAAMLAASFTNQVLLALGTPFPARGARWPSLTGPVNAGFLSAGPGLFEGGQPQVVLPPR